MTRQIREYELPSAAWALVVARRDGSLALVLSKDGEERLVVGGLIPIQEPEHQDTGNLTSKLKIAVGLAYEMEDLDSATVMLESRLLRGLGRTSEDNSHVNVRAELG